MRIIIDTNIFISALINQTSREKLQKILKNSELKIIVSKELLEEIYEVANRPKFSKYITPLQIKYITPLQINKFIEIIIKRSNFIETHSVVNVSPDPKDNFLLELAKDGKANYLITGNKKDLLDLVSFNNTQIISFHDFLKNLDNFE